MSMYSVFPCMTMFATVTLCIIHFAYKCVRASVCAWYGSMRASVSLWLCASNTWHSHIWNRSPHIHLCVCFAYWWKLLYGAWVFVVAVETYLIREGTNAVMGSKITNWTDKNWCSLPRENLSHCNLFDLAEIIEHFNKVSGSETDLSSWTYSNHGECEDSGLKKWFWCEKIMPNDEVC